MASKTRRKRRTKGEGSLIKRRNHYYLRQLVDERKVEIALKNEDGSLCTTQDQASKAVKLMDRSVLELDTQEKIVQKVAEIRHLKVVHQAQSSDVWQIYINSASRPDTGTRALEEQRNMFHRFGDWMQEHYHTGLDGVTPAAASEYMHEVGERVSNRTFNGYVQTLRLIYRTVYKQLGMVENPFDDIRHRPLETVSRKEFTEEQVKKIFDGFKEGFFYETEIETQGPGHKRIRKKKLREYHPKNKDEMEVLMKLCCYSGCDGQSGCLMKWENIDLDRNQIHYVRRKTRKKNNGLIISLPIHLMLREALLKALQWRQIDSPYILPNVAERYQRYRYGVQKDAMKIIHCALGVETSTRDTEGKRALPANLYSLHSFRHSFCSFCANAGVPLDIVAEIVGHGNPVMTRHYTHVNNAAKENAISVLPMLNGQRTEVPDTVDVDAEAVRRKLISMINSADASQLKDMAVHMDAAGKCLPA